MEESKNKDGHGRRKRKGLGATWVTSTNVRRCWRRRVRHNQRLAVLMVGFLTSYSYSSRSRRTRLACDFSSSSWGCLFSFFFPPPVLSFQEQQKLRARSILMNEFFSSSLSSSIIKSTGKRGTWCRTLQTTTSSRGRRTEERLRCGNQIC